MPPNRKSHVNFADTVDILKGANVVHAKFLPLTGSVPAPIKKAAPSQTSNQSEERPRDSTNESEAYWDWSFESQSKEAKRERLLAQILEKDRLHHLLSTKHIEEHLIRTPYFPTTQQSSPQVASDVQARSDAYWAWSSPSGRPMASNDNYWFLPPTQPHTAEDQQKGLLSQILEQEACRDMFSADHIVDNLKRSAQELGRDAAAINATGNDSYWAW